MSKTANPLQSVAAWWQAAPFTAVFAVFFMVPLALVLMVSFWNFNDYELLPGFTFKNYISIFEGCGALTDNGDLCVTLATYLSAR
jgi:putative spermidine/putrescine transport system permease protein